MHNATPSDKRGFQWDWVTFAAIAIVVALLLVFGLLVVSPHG